MELNRSYEDVLEVIIAGDSRYDRLAYHFVREGLDYTQESISKQEEGAMRHITGQELLGGMRAYALEQYGPMALTVLNEWGIERCEDFGEIVFNMVENELLAKTEEDSRDDFSGGYTFDEAFRQPFLPPEKPHPHATQRNVSPVKDASGDRAKPSNPAQPESTDKP